MNKAFLSGIIFMFIFFTSGVNIIEEKSGSTSAYKSEMKQNLLSIWMAYPDYIKGIERVSEKEVYMVLKSGQKLLYDDFRKKGHEEKLNNPDIQDMFEQMYPLSDIDRLMDNNFDPGRIRIYPLLREVYGNSSKEVQNKLVRVKMGGSSCSFSDINGGANALRKTMEELMPLAMGNKDIYNCILPHMGTFNYRVISGTNRLSPHSFGIAIDLSSNKWDYWKWTSRENGEKRLKKYPREIVRAFENNNFVWGGKWGHFDILHFEYRPEIIIKSRYFSHLAEGAMWYGDVVTKNEEIKKYIDIIDKELGL